MTHELFTSCTACGAVFEITLEQLSVANGAVRCGVCGTTFNARESLRETADLDGELAGEADVPTPAVASDDEDAPAPSPPPPPAEQDTAWAAFDADDDTRTDQGSEFVDIGLPTGVEAPLPAQTTSPAVAEATEEEALDDLLDTSRVRPSLASSLAWGLAGVVLLALALVQVAVYWRHQLVQVAWINGPLVQVNAALGTPLDFSYDVERYRFVDRPRLLVDTLAADVEADDDQGRVLEVRAELANDAQVPQPLPHLRLILEDRWGRPVASRTLPPAEYLADRRPAQQFLQPDERVSASARVATRENTPQAYTLDICLPASLGKLDCGDTPTKR